MNKSYTPRKDPQLKEMLQQIESPQLPEGFSGKVMNSVRLRHKTIEPTYHNTPVSIKVGIPLFLFMCIGLLTIFPADETGLLQWLSAYFNGNGISSFLDKLNNSIQNISLPEIQISQNLMWYLLGGIGLFWLFALFENFTRRIGNFKQD